ncbi:MAG: hypothetical protein R8K46_10525 [Mariprofundaceae bacterium]
MRKIALVMAAALLATGCASEQFMVRQTIAGFTDSDNLLYIAENNRLSKQHLDADVRLDEIGLYINPFVEKNKSTNEIITLGFKILNKPAKNRRIADFNRLGRMRNVTFLLHTGEPLILQVTNQETSLNPTIAYETWTDESEGDPYSTNPYKPSVPQQTYSSYEVWETGIMPISFEDFARLANATIVSCEIAGSRGTAVYHEADLSDAFSANLKTFFLTYVQ